MYDFSVFLENESGSRLPPFSVEEGSRRVPKLENAAGFAVVEGELHMRHCGGEAAEVRILRSGRARAVRQGQSYRVMPGDSLCVANREYHVSGVYRTEQTNRSLLGMAARSIALGAVTAAALLVGCNTNANPTVPQTAPVAAANENPADKPSMPDPIAECLSKSESAYDKAGCCMNLSSEEKVQKCCIELHKTSPDVYCSVDELITAGVPDPDWLECMEAKDKPKCCMNLPSDDDKKECCSILHKEDPSVFCEVPDRVKSCLADHESVQDKAKCCMNLSSAGDPKKCCDALHDQDPSAYCKALPRPIRSCFADPESAQDKAKCCMGLSWGGDTKDCCDELHKEDPSVYCEALTQPIRGCLTKPESAKDKANCCLDLPLNFDKKECCDALHKQDPSVSCELLPKPIQACLAKPGSAKDKAKCCMNLDSSPGKCCHELHKVSPDVYCSVKLQPLGGVAPIVME